MTVKEFRIMSLDDINLEIFGLNSGETLGVFSSEAECSWDDMEVDSYNLVDQYTICVNIDD